MYRRLSKGMGEAVAKRTILRKKDNDVESWDHVALRVAFGNTMLHPDACGDYDNLKDHIAMGRVLMSGRHLQHGDKHQPERNMEVFTNCSTAATSFLLFYLLLNGSGVGRSYDDDMMLVNWDFMPNVKVVLDNTHADFNWEEDESVQDAKKKYRDAEWYTVEDSREGWAKVVEIIETLAYEKTHKDRMLIFDFSNIRAKGTPIGGMQDRPASGPRPTMRAIQNVCSVKGTGMQQWEQAMWVDHYLAQCVLVGGARRAARMSTKWWGDKDILQFVEIKRGGFLWSSNNSITVDADFWKQDTDQKKEVLEKVLYCSYHDGTGEPGFINQDKLEQNDEGLDDYETGDFVKSKKYQLFEPAKKLMAHLLHVVKNKKYTQITNPCGEITLHTLGGYCVIADVVPYYSESDDQAEDAFRAATRALIRVNLMDSLYKKEVTRSNRIGVGMTGLHEFAWKRFKFSFRDLINEEKSQEFWDLLKRFSEASKDEAEKYSKQLGVNTPHTVTTIKPAGTTSKLFGLCEGAHLPSMKEYLRWVQFIKEDPLIEKYKKLGYPVKFLNHYLNTTVVGFPTQPEICKLRMGHRLVTAAEATPEEQYKFLMLLEKYWIGEKQGNQISYTLKYNPELVSYEQFKEMITKYQPLVKCCTVMPQTDASAYEYQPEEAITTEQFIQYVEAIEDSELLEDINLEHLRCESGACPI